jgi:hypothetical protein
MRSVAVAGDCVHVLPGVYANDTNLGKNGVFYWFDMGAKIIPASPDGTIIWYLSTALAAGHLVIPMMISRRA